MNLFVRFSVTVLSFSLSLNKNQTTRDDFTFLLNSLPLYVIISQNNFFSSTQIQHFLHIYFNWFTFCSNIWRIKFAYVLIWVKELTKFIAHGMEMIFLIFRKKKLFQKKNRNKKNKSIENQSQCSSNHTWNENEGWNIFFLYIFEKLLRDI